MYDEYLRVGAFTSCYSNWTGDKCWLVIGRRLEIRQEKVGPPFTSLPLLCKQISCVYIDQQSMDERSPTCGNGSTAILVLPQVQNFSQNIQRILSDMDFYMFFLRFLCRSSYYLSVLSVKSVTTVTKLIYRLIVYSPLYPL